MRPSLSLGTAFLGLAALSLATPLQAQDTPLSDRYWYVGGDLGYARDKFSTDRAGWSGTSANNAALGLRGGYQFSRYLSVEGTLSSLGSVEARSGDSKDKFTVGALSANVVGHLPVTERFSLLGIVGVGWEYGRRRGDVESSNKSAGLINLGVGAAYDISPNWRVRAQYINYGKLSWKGGNDASVSSQVFTIGADYRFR